MRAITVDGPAFHNLGANASWELAGGIAAGVAYLRVLTEAGLSVADALRQISFRFAADDDQFMTIAKLRAARQLWARVAEVVGEPDAGAAMRARGHLAADDGPARPVGEHAAQHAGGVRRRRRRRRHRAGATRSTWRSPAASPASRRSFARRIARNTQLLLLEESHLGRVLDPAGGSWFVEDLTEQLAEQAWEHFQDIEARGGFADGPRLHRATRSPRWRPGAPTTSRTAAPRSPASTNSRTSPKLPCRKADSLPTVAALRARLRSAARPLRCLPGRAPARGPQVLLLPLGPLAEHNIRDHVRGEPAGFRRYRGGQPGTASTPPVSRRRVSDAGVADVAVICGTDARYGDEASDVVRGGARAPGVERSTWPGRRRPWPTPISKPDGYLTAKIDAVEALSDLLTRLGA